MSLLFSFQTLLSFVSKATKVALGRIGVFTVTSFHALVCARTPLSTATLYNKNKKRGLLSTFKADSTSKLRPKSPRPFSPQSGYVPLPLSLKQHYLFKVKKLKLDFCRKNMLNCLLFSFHPQ